MLCHARSGTLLVDHASLHVVLAATHSFDRSLMETLVEDNVNPIDKVERSALIMAGAVHAAAAADMLEAGDAATRRLLEAVP